MADHPSPVSGPADLRLRSSGTSRASSVVPSQVVTDEHVFLIGRPPLGEFLGFVEAMSDGGRPGDRGELAEEWRSANDHIRELEVTEAGWADTPPVAPLPTELQPLEQHLAEDPVFRRSFQLVPASVAMVELDRLVVFQKHINLDFVRSLRTRLSQTPSEVELFTFCLPLDHPHPPTGFSRTGQNTFTFVSPSTDFRLLDVTPIDPGQISDYQPSGLAVGVVALVVGYGSNFLNAFHVEDRLVLNNGSHRAFALREHGVTHAPCIVQHISRREEIEVVCSGAFREHPDRFLRHPRPPVLKDYFDPALRKIVRVPRKRRMIKVSFGLEQADIPTELPTQMSGPH